MRPTLPLDLDRVLALTGATRLAGERTGAAPLLGVAPLDSAGPDDLAFLAAARDAALLASTGAGAVLVPAGLTPPPDLRRDLVLLAVARPTDAMSAVCRELERVLWPASPPGIHPTAVVDPSATVHPTASIGPGVVIEAGATIGAEATLGAGSFVGRHSSVGPGSWLGPRVTIYPHCTVGARARLHSGVVIGADGFGFAWDGTAHRKVPQVGTVEIGDDVELGANTCVDRGRLGPTVIGTGTKADNFVQIAHGVRVGRHCILVAYAGLAGSCTLEDGVVIGAQSSIDNGVRVGAGAQVGGRSGTNRDLAAGGRYFGVPAVPIALEMRLISLRSRLPELFQRVSALEKASARGPDRMESPPT